MAEIILFGVSVLPVILLGLYIYKKDKNKEPTRLLIKLFVGGVLSCFLTFFITEVITVFIPFFGSDPQKLSALELIPYVFIGIALIEETSKFIFVYKFSFNEIDFDELYDGLLYAGFVALGFDCFENLAYVYSSGISVGILRAVLAVPGHFCDGIMMGYFLGNAKYHSLHNNDSKKKLNLFYAILVPMLMHGFYDYCLFAQLDLLLILFFIFVIVTYIYVSKKIKKISEINKKMKYKNNFCPNCGAKVGSDFCPKCGNKNQ